MYYTNKPIEKTEVFICDSPSKDQINLISQLPIHSIEEKEFFDNPGERAERNTDTYSMLLTDGDFSSDIDHHNKKWFRFNRGGGRIITFKLPYTCAVNGFCISCLRYDLFGIRTPRYIKFRVSADGENFMTVYNNTDARTERDRIIHKLKGSFDAVQAQYVQFVIDVHQHIFIDELEVYGCTDISNAAIPVSNDIPLFENLRPQPQVYNAFPAPEVAGANNIALSYNHRLHVDHKGLKSVDDYLPLVAYLDKDGNILDTFMDGYLFLPDGSFDKDTELIDGCFSVKGWQDFIDSIYTPHKNMAALNEATRIVKEALDIPDYKVKAYCTILNTFPWPEQFGEVNGETLVFNGYEPRMKAIKWLIDSYDRRFKEGNYENIELKGFYWYEEAIDPCDKNEHDLVRFTCEYAHSLGYKVIWIPYYRAEGYLNWKDFGIDGCCMQPNYAFEDCIPIDRLYIAAEEAKKYGMSIELEVWKIQEDENGNIDNPGNIEKFFDYLYVGAETGFMHSTKMYYFGSAIGNCISNGWKSKNDRYRDMYDTCYLFAKEKLDPAYAKAKLNYKKK